MHVALTMLIVTAVKPPTVPFQPDDLKLARTAVHQQFSWHSDRSHFARHPDRRSVAQMIRELEHRAWCWRFDLLTRGLPMDPPKRPPMNRAGEPFDQLIEQMSEAAFDKWSRQLVLDEITDQQLGAAGAERYASALRHALHERGLPSPPVVSTRPTSLLSEHPARVRAAS